MTVGNTVGFITCACNFVSGGTLEDRLHQGRLSPNESVQILKQVASALECSHGKDVVHRDVKPANVLVSRRRHPRTE